MKKSNTIISIILAFVLSFSFSYSKTLAETKAGGYTYIINYYRFSGDYNDRDMWTWEVTEEGNHQNGGAETFNKGLVDGFMQSKFEKGTRKIGIIMRKSDWSDKDVSFDRFVEIPKDQNSIELWVVEGEEEIFTKKEDVDLSPKVGGAFLESKKEILVSLNTTLEQSKADKFYLKEVQSDNTEKEIKLKSKKVGTNNITLTIADNETIDPTKIYKVGSDEYSPKLVIMRGILNEYSYSGNDLGLIYTQSQSKFKVWAPTAKTVDLVIYDNAGVYNNNGYVTDHTGGKEYAMTKNSGVWKTTISEDLKGKYYMYKVSFADGKVNYAVDPYAKATSANGQRTAIVDLSETNPSNWNETKNLNMGTPTDAILYELHVRDFSIDNNASFVNKGKFKAFTEENLTTASGNKIGIDHLEELGVNYVHLLPVYDFRTVNELKGNEFNWGYDPQNYNVPEGSYSTDPTNPKTRIIEFKEMVQALHKKEIGVIMDVVYNHTASIEDGPFNKIVPNYFYRMNDKGQFTNGSGCGNEVASEYPMVRKYIKDSLKYWVSEYGVDGFRFDLMGLIDVQTMKEITQELRAEFGQDIIIYGEPWQAGGSPLPEEMQTTKGKQKNNGFAVFNDNIRWAIKGDSDGSDKGFATGNTSKEGDIKEGVLGSIYSITDAPTETINYVTAHDNLNLWDKVIKTQGLEQQEGFVNIRDGQIVNGGSVEEAVKSATPHSAVDLNNVLDNETVKRTLLANGIVLTSQGVPFIHAGDELLRTKYGDHNSYKSPDAINQIIWEYKDKFVDVNKYYKGLIELRKSHPAFRMTTKEDIEKNIDVYKTEDGLVAFNIKNNANGDSWRNIVVIYNANSESKLVELPKETMWNIVVNEKQAGTTTLEVLDNANEVNVEGISVMVLWEDISKNFGEVIEDSKTKLNNPQENIVEIIKSITTLSKSIKLFASTN